jgi:hypothetical protein
MAGTGQSFAGLLGVPGVVVAGKLTGHLLREIVMRGSRGGPLFPLASQLNHDMSHADGKQITAIMGHALEALARLDDARHRLPSGPTDEAAVNLYLVMLITWPNAEPWPSWFGGSTLTVAAIERKLRITRTRAASRTETLMAWPESAIDWSCLAAQGQVRLGWPSEPPGCAPRSPWTRWRQVPTSPKSSCRCLPHARGYWPSHWAAAYGAPS